MQIGIRPLLMPSRLADTEQRIMWGDEHWARLSGSGAVAEVVDGNLSLAMSLRNSGSGYGSEGWGFDSLLARYQGNAPPLVSVAQRILRAEADLEEAGVVLADALLRTDAQEWIRLREKRAAALAGVSPVRGRNGPSVR
jgi:hypothetical protein